MTELKNRYDFVLFFDVQDGNPNGDPDAGNMPRVDNETGLGLVSDVCLKRKVRNFIQLTKKPENGYDIIVRSKEISGFETFMNKEICETYKANNIACEVEDDGDKAFSSSQKKRKKEKAKDGEKGKKVMCAKYFDIRTFGAVLTNGTNAVQVRGPVQLTFARSIDQIQIIGNTLTVCAARKEDKSYESQVGIQGNKFTVPYGLYVAHGFVSPQLAAQTGFSEEDLGLFFKALTNMFEYDRSAARGMMASRKLVVFKHADALGNAPAWKLFDLVHARKKENIAAPRAFQDYDFSIDTANCPQGVEILELI